MRGERSRIVATKSVVSCGAALALSVAVVGCSNINAPKEEQGMVGGAVAGAVVGSAIGRAQGHGGGLIGGVAGALAGGIIGSSIGRSMDDRDRAMAQRAEYDAYAGPPGQPVRWRNPDNGRYGEVVPGPYYYRGPRQCRDFTHTVYIDGRPQPMNGVACRNPDGTWTNVS